MAQETGTHERQPQPGGLRRQPPVAPQSGDKQAKAGEQERQTLDDGAPVPGRSESNAARFGTEAARDLKNGGDPIRGRGDSERADTARAAEGGDAAAARGDETARDVQGGEDEPSTARDAEGGAQPMRQATERDADANEAHAVPEEVDEGVNQPHVSDTAIGSGMRNMEEPVLGSTHEGAGDVARADDDAGQGARGRSDAGEDPQEHPASFELDRLAPSRSDDSELTRAADQNALGGEAVTERNREGGGGTRSAAEVEAEAEDEDDDDDDDGEADPNEVGEDEREIITEAAHIPDRDQEFEMRGNDSGVRQTGLSPDQFVGGDAESEIRGMQDVDEGEWGRVSDPAYEREGSSRIQRAVMGDRSVEDHMTPAAVAGIGGNDDPRGLERLTRDQLYDRAKALNIPGRSKMSKDQLSVAVREALAH